MRWGNPRRRYWAAAAYYAALALAMIGWLSLIAWIVTRLM
jgi:hypothetical protein